MIIAKSANFTVNTKLGPVNVLLELSSEPKNITELEIAILNFLQIPTQETLNKFHDLELEAEAQAAVDITLETLGIVKQT